MLVALCLLVLVVGLARNHAPGEAALLLALLGGAAIAGRWLARDFVAHPANFPAITPAAGLRMPSAPPPAAPSRWGSVNRARDRAP
jgi:hypothetical protein